MVSRSVFVSFFGFEHLDVPGYDWHGLQFVVEFKFKLRADEDVTKC
jgi:hypothetical protein